MRKARTALQGRIIREGDEFKSLMPGKLTSERDKGIAIDERQIRLAAPLKEIGVVDVAVHLHAEIETTVKVWVVQQKPQ